MRNLVRDISKEKGIYFVGLGGGQSKFFLDELYSLIKDKWGLENVRISREVREDLEKYAEDNNLEVLVFNEENI